MGLTAFDVPNLAAVGHVRRRISDIAHTLGFLASQISELKIVSTELATNLVKNHAVDGKVFVRPLKVGQELGLEIASVDSGPGIVNVDAALSDHFSTCGTGGIGLGAIVRLMDQCDVFSRTQSGISECRARKPDPVGTIVTCRKWVKAPKSVQFEHCTLTRPHPGETANGDGCLVKQTNGQLLIAIADGVGHGEHAEEASQRALSVVEAHSDEPFADLFPRIHRLLKRTRGAVVTLLRLDSVHRTLEHAGVGNVVMRTYPRENSGLMTRPGTLGFGKFKQPRVTTTTWPVGTTVLIHTDGITGGWSLDRFPDLLNSHPSTIAHYLMRDFRHPSDDSTIAVIRDGGRDT